MSSNNQEYLKQYEGAYVEEPFLQQLEGMNWQAIRLKMHSQEAKESYRSDFNEVLLLPVLREALGKINPWLEADQVEEVITKLNIKSSNNLLETNKALLNLLLENPITAQNRQINRSETVRVVDFDNPDNNSFIAISQLKLRILGTENHIYPDIVLFLNGLPVVVVECKSPKVNDSIYEAIEQLLRYSEQRGANSEGCPALFFFNQFLIVTERTEAKFGTITTHSEKHFYRWSDPYPRSVNDLEHGQSAPNQQQRLVAGMLDKANLLDIIRTFTLFATDDKGKMIKVVGRYQQFRAVKKATERLLSGKNRIDRSGIIWHTQGSGKSLTMMFMVREMYRHTKLCEWKIIFITDRTQLEEQLAETSRHIGFTVKVAESVSGLKALLRSDSSDLVMAMIHKFQERDLDLKTLFPELNNDHRILIMTDEAHRSQYSTLAANLDKALPNATRIGYTGTPIDKTEKLFGAYIDKYTMKQAIDDGVTLQIIYEGRTHKAEVSDKETMDAVFKDVFSECTFNERLEILSYGSARAYLEAESTIQAKAEDMVKHYLAYVFSAGFKAQVVATSREAATRYKTYIDNELKTALAKLEQDNPNKLNLDRLKKLKTAVVISGNHNDLPHIKVHTDSRKHKTAIKSFKLSFDSEDEGINGDVGILIVTNMLLTGFDAPIEQVMYLDKVIVSHNLLQAIARVNRVGDATKDKGFVVDYVGIGHHLKKALEVYEEKEQKEVIDSIGSPDDELRALNHYFNELKALFKKYGLTDWEDYDAFFDLFENEDIRFKFILLFKDLTRTLNNLYPHKEALNYLADYQKLVGINVMAGKYFRDKRLSMKGIPEKLRAITDAYLISKGIDQKVEPISILDAGFEEEINKHKRTKTKAAAVEHAIQHHLEITIDDADNPSFAAELARILKDYAGNWDKIYTELEKLRQEIKNKYKDNQKPPYGLSKEQFPFFKLLRKQFFQEAELTDNQISLLVDVTQRVFYAITRELELIGFWNSSPAQNQLRSELLRILLSERFVDLPNIFADRNAITSDMMQLAYKNNAIILAAD
jgi:type I restriction enzyme R subunit